MTKGLRVLVMFVVLAGLLVVGGAHVALAQNTQFPAYTSGIQVANLDTSVATVVLIGYNPDGSQSGSALNDTIPVNGSKTYFPISNVANGFSGSFVISSDKKIAALSNISSSDGLANASYVGRAGGSTTVFLPLLQKDNSGYTSWYSIQNAGTADATVQIAYSDNTTASGTIKPGAAKVFYQAPESHSLKVFAATVTSNQPLVAVVIQEATANRMYAYTGFTGGSVSPVIPLINSNNSGYFTGVQIQNGGTAATDVTVSYTPGIAGTACTETQTIQPKASATFAFYAFIRTIPGENCADRVRFVGSAKVTSNSTSQPLMAVVNQDTSYSGASYTAFNVDEAGNSVAFPLIADRNSGFWTGMSVQNVGTVATTVNCTFSNTGFTLSKNLAPNESFQELNINKIGDRYVGSAICTADAAAKIVGVVNYDRRPGADFMMTYEGIKK